MNPIAQQAAAAALDGALLVQLDERLTPRDVRLLEACWKPQDLDLLDGLGAHQVVWLLHFKLVSTRVDHHDVIWIETTQLGRDLVRAVKGKR
jgi:hypothetical protein